MRIVKNIFKLFYPDLCLSCNTYLMLQEKVLCTYCRYSLPIIKETNYCNNEIKAMFYGKVSVEKVVSFFYLKKEGITQKLIHELKYKGGEDVGVFIGNWLGSVLKDSKHLNDIDLIVPVPLHPSKLKKRGYNQVTSFCLVLSDLLNKPYVPNILERSTISITQTNKNRFDRFDKRVKKFNINDLTVFKNKHILLVDDVITTGATLEACCNTLLKISGVKISIVTMAFTVKN